MPWLLLLHISSLLCWCALLLYLPALLSVTPFRTNQFGKLNSLIISRKIFRLLLTPAALLAIISGTLIVVRLKVTAIWLMVKLTLVSILVICHVLNGWLILKMERQPDKNRVAACLSLGIGSAFLMVFILWLVLAKPF